MADYVRSERGKVVMLGVRGSLDITNSDNLKSEVIAIGEARTQRVVVDLAGLRQIDSSGVGVLMSLFKRVRNAGGKVCFAAVNGQPQEVFRVLRMDRALDICPTVEDALQRLGTA